jgi:hypothetical protein
VQTVLVPESGWAMDTAWTINSRQIKRAAGRTLKKIDIVVKFDFISVFWWEFCPYYRQLKRLKG